MAKKIVDEQIKLSIIIDGNQAQSELYKVEKSTRELTAVNKTLLAEKNKLERQGKKEEGEYKKLTSTIRQNNLVIKENKTRISELQNQIGVTGMTMGQLNQKANQLKLTLKHLVPGSPDYTRYDNDLNKITARLNELKGKAQATGLTIGTVADKFNRYAALVATIIASLTGVVLSIQHVLDYNGKLSDSQSDVMKTTGMTKKEVDGLTKSFGLFKTRTARIELLKLAEEGGRLGIEGVENIQKWINVANQLKVALGDDLSETQIREVGKMVEVYRVAEETGKDFEGSLLSLGSAINEVSASGSNQAGFLVDFIKRTGGLSQSAKLAAADNLGYAATFDEIGQSAEVSGTVMNKLMTDMFSSSADYAKIANMNLKDFTNLLNTDFNEAMIAFLKGLEGNNAGLDILSARMADLDIGGSRGVAAIAALSANLHILEERQNTSNVAMQEATSLTDEYNIKNNNLAASLEKIKKTVVGWYSSETLIEWLESSVNWFAKFIGATEDTEGTVSRFKNGLITTTKVFAVLLAAMITNVAWQKLVALWTTRASSANLLYIVGVKARIVSENLAKIGTLSYIAVTSLLTGNLKKATIATRGLALALMTTPFGAILAIVAAVTTAFVLFSEKTNEATWAQKELTKAKSDSIIEIKKEESSLRNLVRVANDETKSKEQREKAIKQINDISPEYLGNITLENIKTQETTKAINNYIKALDKKMKLQAVEKTLESTYEREKELKSKDKSDYMYWYDYLLNGWYDIDQTAEDRKQEEIRQLFEDRVSLMNEMEKMMNDNSEPQKGIVKEPSNYIPTSEDKNKKGKSESEKNHEKRLTEIKKYYESALKLSREYEDGNFELMKDGYSKQKQILENQHQRNIEDLKSKLISTSEIEKAQNASKNLKLTEQQRKSYADLANAWLKNNTEVYKKVEQETDLHCLKLASVVENYANNEIDLLDKKFNKEKTAREIAFNESLIVLGNNQKKREKEEKKFNDEEYKLELEHLENLLNLYTNILGNKLDLGIDFDLLTPEAAKKLNEDIKLVELAVAKLKAAKSGESNKQTDKLGNNEADLNLGQVDVLGFSQQQWETFYKNIENGTIGIQTMTMAVYALQNIWSQYGAMVEAGENRRLQQYEQTSSKKQQRLQRQLNSGMISQDQYNKAVEAIDADFARKKAQLEYKQAKRKRKMDLASAFTSTALAVLNGLNTQPFFPLGLAMSALAGIMGGIQIATIAKQPLPAPGFESGYYSNQLVKRQQDGKIFKSTFGGKTKSGVVNRPTHFLTGENGPEMIIDSKAFRQMNPNLRESLIREIRGIKGFEGGYYNPESMSLNVSNDGSITSGEFLAVLIQIRQFLEKLESKEFIATVSNKDYSSMRNLKDGIKEYENFRNRNKIK